MKNKFFLKTFFIFLLININLLKSADNLDTSFANGVGYITTGIGTKINSINIQSDGKIIAAGTIEDSNTRFFITRYDNQGILDTTFGNDGIFTTEIGSKVSNSQILSSVLQSDGKIVVVGFFIDKNTLKNLVIARLNTDGTLDKTFGKKGITTTLIGDGSTANAVAIQSNGKIVVTGTAVINGQPNIIIVRYTTVGDVDATFGNQGIVSKVIGVRSFGNSLAIDSFNNILIGGSSSDGLTSNKFLLLKYNFSGQLDTTFGNQGIVLTTIGNISEIKDLAIDSNNKIVVAGYNNSDFNVLTIARYTSSGVLDTTFNSNGIQTYSDLSRADSVIIDSSNNIYVGGFNNITQDSFLIGKYTSTGSLDNNFGNNGIITNVVENQSIVNAIAMQTDSKIVSGGNSVDSNNQYYGIIARYNKNNTNYVSITNIANNSTLNQKVITLSGTSSGNNSPINIYLDDVAFGSQVTTDASGNWASSTFSSVLSEGVHKAKVDLLDNNNNVLVSTYLNFNIDTSAASSYASGNELRVDKVFGDDSIASRNGGPFATISKALSVAQPGDTVRIFPGTYNESFIVPNFVSIRGVSAGTCIISKDVTTATDLVTMGEYCILEDLTLQLTSVNHVLLRGVVFPGTTTITSALRGVRIKVDNSTAPSNGSSNVYGIHVTGNGYPNYTLFSSVEISLDVNSIGGGSKRGILINSACGFNLGISVINVSGSGAGTFIGVETNNANAIFESHVSIIKGVSQDISQTLGVIKLYNTDLESLKTNGFGFQTQSTSGILGFADTGSVSSGIKYLRLGTASASAVELPFSLSTGILVKALNVKLLSSPGVGQSVTVTLRKNGTNTASTVTLSGVQTSGSDTLHSVKFAAGDSISVSINGSLLNTASDIIVTLELY